MATIPEPEVLDLEPLTRLMECINVAQRNSSTMVSKLKDFENRLQILDEKMLPIQKVYSHYWSLITLYTTRVHPSSQRRRRILASHLLKLKELTNIFD